MDNSLATLWVRERLQRFGNAHPRRDGPRWAVSKRPLFPIRNSVDGNGFVNHDDLVIIGRVAGALTIGAMIGFERTFHGRPAGFRTHSLVCIASAILMIVTVYQNQWMTFVEHDAIRTDPTRMAQGIMTGIGFLARA